MKKKILWACGIVFVACVISIPIDYYMNGKPSTPEATPEEEEAAEKRIETAFTEKDENYNGFLPNDLDELKVQHLIHNMTHQKVEAEQKWGHERLTKPKVDRLLEVVEINIEIYEYESAYIEILERWSEGDFSNAVQDHNAIWKLQNGTIGEAYRLLTPVEEERYIQEHFNSTQQ